MWTHIDMVYSSSDSQNAWAALAATNAWHRIVGSVDGVTNVHLILTAARANNRQAYVVRDRNNIIQAYM
jgi:hypothetical protein